VEKVFKNKEKKDIDNRRKVGYYRIMNIFELNKDPAICAEMHCDKHIVKMPIEYAQLLSTAHRVLDGTEYIGTTKTGRRAKRWRLDDDRENFLYKASHVKHPDGIWLRQTSGNYYKLFFLYMATLAEFKHRYGKIHGASKPSLFLQRAPMNIPEGPITELPQCMPDYCKGDNVIQAYHKYYINEKKSFATWKARPTPEWYLQG